MDRPGFSLGRMFQMLGLYARMDFAWLVRDTRVCLIAMLSDTVSLLASISGVFLLAWRFDGVGGMDKYEVLLMLSLFSCVNGLQMLFFGGTNVSTISRRIGRSQLDHMVMQPVSIPLQLLTEGFLPVSGTGPLICGIALLAYALQKLGVPITAGLVLGIGVQLLGSLLILMAMMYLVSCAAFYAPVAGEEISSVLGEAMGGILSTFPLSGLHTGVQILFITVFPVGMMSWFPARALLGNPPLGLGGLYTVLLAAALWAITAILFRKGWKHYAHAGCNRYRAMGHRR